MGNWKIPHRVASSTFSSDWKVMKHTGAQLLPEQRGYQHSQRAAHLCVWKQDGVSLGENRQLIQNGVAKWEKPPRGFGTVKMKFRKENHQMLPLTIIRKKKHRDELKVVE